MIDLVKRLEAQRQNWYDGPTQDFHQVQDPLCAEAAALIRDLQQQLKTAREALERCNRVLNFDLRKMIVVGPDYNQAVKDAADTSAAAIRSLGEKE